MISTFDPYPLPMRAIGATDAQGLDLAGAPGDFAVFDVPYKCQIIEVGLIITEDVAGDNTLGVVAVDKRPTAGSDDSRGDADIAGFDLDTLLAAPVAGKRRGTPGRQPDPALSRATGRGPAGDGRRGQRRRALHALYPGGLHPGRAGQHDPGDRDRLTALPVGLSIE